MRKSPNVFLLAVLLGALSAALIYRHLRTLRAEAEAARRPSVDIVIAKESIAIGSRIEPNQVGRAAWPADMEPEGAVHDPATVVGTIALTRLEKNQPVLQAQVTAQGTGLLPLMITEGMRAMSVKVDNVTGVSGFITPNSRVDVMVAGQPDGAGNEQERSKVVLQNVRVLATGKSIEQRDEKPVEVPTVTLMVTPEEAETLTLAARHEPVRLALRNFQDEAIVDTPGISSRTLFGGGFEERNEPTGRGGYAVELIAGATRSIQVVR